MKRFSIFILLLIVLACFKDKEGPNCHYNILLYNNSEQTISTGIKLLAGPSINNLRCNIAENLILPKGVYTLSGPLYTCWEDEMRFAGDFEIFVVDPEQTDDKYGFYDCDSIYSYNKILRHYKFTVEEMKEKNFIINYPEDKGIEPKE